MSMMAGTAGREQARAHRDQEACLLVGRDRGGAPFRVYGTQSQYIPIPECGILKGVNDGNCNHLKGKAGLHL